LYDLRTNQLVNTFQRQNLNNLNLLADIPDSFTISKNIKLLAYKSGNQIKLYLIESSLELASIMLETGGTSFADYFMYFLDNDERLLIYQSESKWSIWNIFSSIQESIKLEGQFNLNLHTKNIFWKTNYQLVQSNTLIAVIKNKEEDLQVNLSEDKRIY
ncbi:7227_t:CDS:1, partial [Cetraspora pellucida]